ncbi:MAG: hypothetical protein JRJ29_16695 [Deltaproteobacteria bacterium]|nr:hypothetical protein [Deltaproteobacteria bacterium]
METVYYLVLIPMVYVAFGIFFLGTVFRLVKIMRAPRNPSTLEIFPEKRPKWPLVLYDTFLMPTVRRHKPVLWVFLMAFHIAFLLLIIGHLELIRDFQVFQRYNWCCGGGGGLVALGEETLDFRMKSSRVKVDQVNETGAKILATACENCHTQLSNLNDHYKMGVDVQFLSSLIAGALVQQGIPPERANLTEGSLSRATP